MITVNADITSFVEIGQDDLSILYLTTTCLLFRHSDGDVVLNIALAQSTVTGNLLDISFAATKNGLEVPMKELVIVNIVRYSERRFLYFWKYPVAEEYDFRLHVWIRI